MSGTIVGDMRLRDSLMAGLAGQLGRPSGLRGRAVGAMLNRANRNTVGQAVDALSLPSGAVTADVGFGGGVGLDLLLRAVGGTGTVHGVDVSQTMLTAAASRFRRDIRSGRLHLHNASMSELPLPDDSLDGLLTVNTIYFVPELAGPFAEFTRVVRDTGRVVIGLGHPDAMEKEPYTAYGFRIRPVADVIEALSSAGLRVEQDVRVGQGADAVHLLVAAPLAAP